MIHSIEFIPSSVVTTSEFQNKSNKTKKEPRVTCNNDDHYISNNPTRNLQQGLKCGDVEYVKPVKLLWGLLTLKDERYRYNCNGRETIGDIKTKFGIPDHVIFRINRIKDDDYIPAKGIQIEFNYNEDD